MHILSNIFSKILHFAVPVWGILLQHLHLISQGSVATCLNWGGQYCMDFVANFIRFPAVQKFWKSVKIWQSYREFKGGNLSLRHSVVLDLLQRNQWTVTSSVQSCLQRRFIIHWLMSTIVAVKCVLQVLQSALIQSIKSVCFALYNGRFF